jgi:hypothetical protein
MCGSLSWRLSIVIAIGCSAWLPTAEAQAPRPRLGSGIRALDREKDKQAEKDKQDERLGNESAEDEEAESSPAAASYA